VREPGRGNDKFFSQEKLPPIFFFSKIQSSLAVTSSEGSFFKGPGHQNQAKPVSKSQNRLPQ
jgi:hypothetical protein